MASSSNQHNPLCSTFTVPTEEDPQIDLSHMSVHHAYLQDPRFLDASTTETEFGFQGSTMGWGHLESSGSYLDATVPSTSLLDGQSQATPVVTYCPLVYQEQPVCHAQSICQAQPIFQTQPICQAQPIFQAHPIYPTHVVPSQSQTQPMPTMPPVNMSAQPSNNGICPTLALMHSSGPSHVAHNVSPSYPQFFSSFSGVPHSLPFWTPPISQQNSFTMPPSPAATCVSWSPVATHRTTAAATSTLHTPSPSLPDSRLRIQSAANKRTAAGKSAAHYACTECSKTFTRPYNLKSHMRTHTNEKPYKCGAEGCSWEFARPHDLKRHSLLHNGMKPHKCPYCEKAFGRRDALMRHLKVDPTCKQLAALNPIHQTTRTRTRR